MVKRLFSSLVFSLSLLLVACASSQSTSDAASRNPSGFLDLFQPQSTDARPLTDQEILSASSSTALKPRQMRVLVDNDAAFDTKIAALKAAQSGDVIRMSYFIYSDDHSSSVFLQELLAAAQRGAEVRLFADLLTNYKLIDLFNYLEKESRGKIKTRFFFSLSPKLLRDLAYLTRPCPASTGPVTPTTCSNQKWQELQKNPNQDAYAKLLLSGILSKNGMAVKIAVAEGQQLDINKMKEGGGNKDETAQLIEFLKLVMKAKFAKDPAATLKVGIAYQLYGEKLNPVMNQINGIVPLEQPEGQSSLLDWEHLTDFTHHKLLMIGNRFIQLGGRNIENSYHMKPNALTQKYIFKDVDAALEVQGGGDSVAASFDRYWTFPGLTHSLAEVQAWAPAEFVMNPLAAQKAYGSCAKGSFGPERRTQLAQCLSQNLTQMPEYKSQDQRMRSVAETIQKNAEAYKGYKKVVSETWSRKGDLSGRLSDQDMQRALITYVENLHYDRRKPKDQQTRVFGSKPGAELESGKYLHALWMRGMENACATTAAAHKKDPTLPKTRVVLHSAYFLPSAQMMKTLGKMIDGSWDCRGARVTILTNSLDTTDLNIINVVGRYQMTAFYNIYANRIEYFGNQIYKDDRSQDPRFNKNSQSNGRAATVDYFEIRSLDQRARVSLHAKVAILGNDAIVGSANGDIRSYYMDTNNGFYLRNATDFVRDYTAWLDQQMKDSAKTKSLVAQFTAGGIPVDQTLSRLHAEDRQMVQLFLSKRNWDKKVKEKQRKELDELIQEVNDRVYEATLRILHLVRNEGRDETQKRTEQMKVMIDFDRWLQLF